jgi:hypothetical protein
MSGRNPDTPGGDLPPGLIDFEPCEYGDSVTDIARMLVAYPRRADTAFLAPYAAAAALPRASESCSNLPRSFLTLPRGPSGRIRTTTISSLI